MDNILFRSNVGAWLRCCQTIRSIDSRHSTGVIACPGPPRPCQWLEQLDNIPPWKLIPNQLLHSTDRLLHCSPMLGACQWMPWLDQEVHVVCKLYWNVSRINKHGQLLSTILPLIQSQAKTKVALKACHNQNQWWYDDLTV